MATTIYNWSTWAATLKAAKAHTALIGEVVHAANLLDDSFYHLFLIALSLERTDEFGATVRFHDHALAIWHVIQSDASQRDMAMAAISTIPTELNLKPALQRLKWAKDCARMLADYRNIVGHNPVMFRGQFRNHKVDMVPEFGGRGSRPAHRKRLELIQNLQFWKTLRNDLLFLSSYVEAVNVQIERLDAARAGAELVGAPKSWPRRPQLRSLPRLREIASMLNRPPAKKKAKRHNPRKSSPK